MNNCVHCGDPTECASDGEYPIHDWSQYEFWKAIGGAAQLSDEVRRHCLIDSFKEYKGRMPTPEEFGDPNIVATPRRDV